MFATGSPARIPTPQQLPPSACVLPLSTVLARCRVAVRACEGLNTLSRSLCGCRASALNTRFGAGSGMPRDERARFLPVLAEETAESAATNVGHPLLRITHSTRRKRGAD